LVGAGLDCLVTAEGRPRAIGQLGTSRAEGVGNDIERLYRVGSKVPTSSEPVVD